MEGFEYKIVSEGERGFTTIIYTYEEILRSFPVYGEETHPSRRSELQGQPKILGVNGPMYEGINNGKIVIRYETKKAYYELSQ